MVECSHEFCMPCLKSYLENLVRECNIGKLKCLEYECREIISNEIAHQVLDEDTYKKFLRFRQSIEIDKNPDLLWCPGPGCETVLKKSQLKKERLKSGNWSCKTCNQEICSRCFLVAHPSKKCPQSNESAFRMWAASGSGVKNCPNCRARTEKNDGCNHMTCHRCRNNWCWICGQTINELHYEQTRIFTGCPGLQFVGAQPWKLSLIMISAFILNPIVFAVGPIVYGFGYSFVLTWKITDRILRAGGCMRNCCACCCVAPWLYLILLAVLLPILTALGAVAAGLLVAIGSPLLMLYIIFFALRLIILNCKAFK